MTQNAARRKVTDSWSEVNLGPHRVSRHLHGAVSPHEISVPGNQHIAATKLNLVSAEVINAYMGLDVGVWGAGSKVGADGTQIEKWTTIVHVRGRHGRHRPREPVPQRDPAIDPMAVNVVCDGSMKGPAMTSIERVEQRDDPQMVPHPIDGEASLVQVDATWGSIQPMNVATGVQTIGEKEVIDHLGHGLPLIDSRTGDFYRASTIPDAVNIPHTEASERIHELDQARPSVLFCNGPQCGQSPHAIRVLLDAGFPPELMLYYRGGLHDWLTLGLPVVAGGEAGAQ